MKRRAIPPANVRLAFCLYLLLVALFEVLRVCLYVRNRDLAAGTGAGAIAGSFVYGLRFDLAVAAYASLALLIVSKLARWIRGESGERRAYVLGGAALGVFFVLAGLAELEFYREFYSRYNMLAIQYWSHPGTVASMIWHGYPVVRYLLVGSLLLSVYLLALVRLARSLMPNRRDGAHPESAASEAAEGGRSARWRPWSEWAWTVLALALLLVASRGGLRGTPLQWGDAVHSDSTFANSLAQNGFWTLGRGLLNLLDSRRAGGTWQGSMPSSEAHERARRLLLLPHEELAGGGPTCPLLRRSLGGERSLSLRPASRTPPNVVVIIMESFSARYVGALGSNNDRTPEFNSLARSGILFDRFFSNGSHTDQAAYCVTASFPNLPGHESLMQTLLGTQRFDTLPAALKSRGYETLFLYNGDLAWDNMYGFFRSQGIDRFIGRDDFDRSGYFDATWGVSDKELFERANSEFRRASGPFCAIVLTLSNHTPFDLPRPLPFPEVMDAGTWNDRMNGIRFADWSIGRFFEMARREPYFRDTLFVLVGDHGFSVPPVLTELNLLRFHVPLLFYAPELLGSEGRLRHTVASQVDIPPTILGLLGDSGPHQHFGRDLFALPGGDPGFAVFKPAGGVDEVGFIRGDLLLVKNAAGRRRLYRYDLFFPDPSVSTVDDVDSRVLHEMDKDLHGYLQTALEVLTSHHAAAEPSPARGSGAR